MEEPEVVKQYYEMSSGLGITGTHKYSVGIIICTKSLQDQGSPNFNSHEIPLNEYLLIVDR